MVGTPAFVLNGRLDLLTANDLGFALYSPVYADPVRPPNNARFIFLDPHATEFFGDWDKAANDTVALLRAEAGRHPYDRGLSDLIGELSTRSNEFRVRWAAHNVRIHTSGVKRIHHPVVGDLELAFESFPHPQGALFDWDRDLRQAASSQVRRAPSYSANQPPDHHGEKPRPRPVRSGARGPPLDAVTRNRAGPIEPAHTMPQPSSGGGNRCADGRRPCWRGDRRHYRLVLSRKPGDWHHARCLQASPQAFGHIPAQLVPSEQMPRSAS
jgi:hypothetical protein